MTEASSAIMLTICPIIWVMGSPKLGFIPEGPRTGVLTEKEFIPICIAVSQTFVFFCLS